MAIIVVLADHPIVDAGQSLFDDGLFLPVEADLIVGRLRVTRQSSEKCPDVAADGRSANHQLPEGSGSKAADDAADQTTGQDA